MATLVYKCVKGDAKSVNKESLTGMLSTNLESIRNEIRNFCVRNLEKVAVCNPSRYIIKTSIDRKDSKTNEDGSVEEEDYIEPDSLNLGTKELNSELIEYMKHEIKSLKLVDKLNGFETIEPKQSDIDYGIDFGLLKPRTAYFISDVNLNTIKFVHLVDELASLFDDVWIIKCGIDDPYTERVCILISERTDDTTSFPPGEYIPINQQNLIDFLYSVYTKAVFMLKADENDYKHIVSSCVALIKYIEP